MDEKHHVVLFTAWVLRPIRITSFPTATLCNTFSIPELEQVACLLEREARPAGEKRGRIAIAEIA